ncbi:MAG TPA: c-type cytochrome [Candidatus Xenobia bacterium]|jgi:mono/diheme cytochrome c family protein
MPKLCAEFTEQDSALAAHRAIVDGGVDPQKIEIRSSYPLVEEAIPPHRTRPFNMRRNVKTCWFIGGITGFAFLSGTQIDWPIYTSGHQILAVPLNMIPTYECAMITGLMTTAIFFFLETKPFRQISPHPAEDLPVARGNIALVVEDESEGLKKVTDMLKGRGARSIVTYVLLFFLGLSTLTGCEVRMRNQVSVKSTDQQQVPQPPGTVSMPTAEEAAVGAPPVFGYANMPDVQRIENQNWGMIPKELQGMKNPVASDAASLARGQDVYANNCAFCHGTGGQGDGPVGQVFKPRPPALAQAATAALSDGAMFWKITVGPNTMPPFANRLTMRDRFDVINYIRQLQKGGAKS